MTPVERAAEALYNTDLYARGVVAQAVFESMTRTNWRTCWLTIGTT